MVRFRLVYRLHGRFQVRPIILGDLAELLDRRKLIVEFVQSDHFELVDGCAVVEQQQKLQFRGAKIDLGGL